MHNYFRRSFMEVYYKNISSIALVKLNLNQDDLRLTWEGEF